MSVVVLVERTFMPTVADWHGEYFEALKEGQKWKARWISLCYRYRFLKVMGLSNIWQVIDKLAKAIKGIIFG